MVKINFNQGILFLKKKELSECCILIIVNKKGFMLLILLRVLNWFTIKYLIISSNENR